jgi:hypothetical protein
VSGDWGLEDITGSDAEMASRQDDLERNPQPCFTCVQSGPLQYARRATCFALVVDGRTAAMIPVCDRHWSTPNPSGTSTENEE